MILLLLVVRQNVVVVETLFCVEDPRDKKKSSSSSSPSLVFPYTNAVLAAADADQTCTQKRFGGQKERENCDKKKMSKPYTPLLKSRWSKRERKL